MKSKFWQLAQWTLFNSLWTLFRALRDSLNENLLASPIINSSHDFNGDSYGRQSLDALAAAALQASTNNNKIANLVSSLSDANGKLKDGNDDDKWMVVGIFKTLTQNVTNYVDYQWESSVEKLTSESVPDLSMLEKIPLEQGRAYRFRIAGVNACGVGKFSEVSWEWFKPSAIFKFVNIYSHHRSKHASPDSPEHHPESKSQNPPMELTCRGSLRQHCQAKSPSTRCTLQWRIQIHRKPINWHSHAYTWGRIISATLQWTR